MAMLVVDDSSSSKDSRYEHESNAIGVIVPIAMMHCQNGKQTKERRQGAASGEEKSIITLAHGKRGERGRQRTLRWAWTKIYRESRLHVIGFS